LITPRDIIIRPVISEKSYDGIEQNKYTFEVLKKTNKIEIKKSIEEVFNVTVEKVNIGLVSPKVKKQGYTSGKTRTWKKAIVTLKKGDKIEFFEAK
jgi:large subunit ribosomal protein L23